MEPSGNLKNRQYAGKWAGGRGTRTDRWTDGRLRPHHSQEQEAQLQGYCGLFPEAKILITQEKAFGWSRASLASAPTPRVEHMLSYHSSRGC